MILLLKSTFLYRRYHKTV